MEKLDNERVDVNIVRKKPDLSVLSGIRDHLTRILTDTVIRIVLKTFPRSLDLFGSLFKSSRCPLLIPLASRRGNIISSHIQVS